MTRWWRLTLRNRRFVKPLYPRQPSMEEKQPLLQTAARSQRSSPTPAWSPPTQDRSSSPPRVPDTQQPPPDRNGHGFGIGDIAEYQEVEDQHVPTQGVVRGGMLLRLYLGTY